MCVKPHAAATALTRESTSLVLLFATDPPLLGLGGGTRAADGIRMKAAEWTTLLELGEDGELHPLKVRAGGCTQDLFLPRASEQWASTQLPRGDDNPFLWSRCRVRGPTTGQSRALCPAYSPGLPFPHALRDPNKITNSWGGKVNLYLEKRIPMTI